MTEYSFFVCRRYLQLSRAGHAKSFSFPIDKSNLYFVGKQVIIGD